MKGFISYVKKRHNLALKPLGFDIQVAAVGAGQLTITATQIVGIVASPIKVASEYFFLSTSPEIEQVENHVQLMASHLEDVLALQLLEKHRQDIKKQWRSR